MTIKNHLTIQPPGTTNDTGWYQDSAYDVQTTDATVTTLWQYALGEGSGITIKAWVTGLRDDHSEIIGGSVNTATLRRDVGGNVTLAGVTTDIDEDSSGSPTFTVDADTTNQLARLRVTGEAGKNINWLATVQYQVLTE